MDPLNSLSDSIVLAKEAIDLLIKEFEISRALAEKTLKEKEGDMKAAALALFVR